MAVALCTNSRICTRTHAAERNLHDSTCTRTHTCVCQKRTEALSIKHNTTPYVKRMLLVQAARLCSICVLSNLLESLYDLSSRIREQNTFLRILGRNFPQEATLSYMSLYPSTYHSGSYLRSLFAAANECMMLITVGMIVREQSYSFRAPQGTDLFVQSLCSYMRMCGCTCVCICIRAIGCACVCVCTMCVCRHTCACACIHVCIPTYLPTMCMCMHTCIYTYLPTYRHTHVHGYSCGVRLVTA